MKRQIEKELAILVGQPLTDVWRIVNLQCFGFGKQYKVERNRPDKKIINVSPYYIHVDCVWRITSPKRILVAHRDLYYPPGNEEDAPEDWQWETSNKCDELTKILVRDLKKNQWIVDKIKADRYGGVQIFFNNKNTLEIFPSDSFDDEYWRFFERNNPAKKHFVVCGNGIDTQN